MSLNWERITDRTTDRTTDTDRDTLPIDHYLNRHGVQVGPRGVQIGPQDPLYAPIPLDEAGEAGDPPEGQGGPAAGQGGPACSAGEATGEATGLVRGGLVRGDTPYLDLDGRRRWGLDYRLPPASADGSALVGLFWGVVFTLGGAGAVGLVVLAGYWLWTVLPELAWRWSR